MCIVLFTAVHTVMQGVCKIQVMFCFAILSKSVCGAVVQITGQEDAMYEAKVTVTTKGRKNDLPLKSGDAISIIRTTNCPKGKWLAKDSSNNCEFRILLAMGSLQE